jgi:hypothetical protein
MSGAAHPSVPSFARRSLRQKILKAALTAPEFRATLTEAAGEIRDIAKPSATEATIEGAFERILYARLREIGLQFHPEKEAAVGTKRHVTRGRMDSRLGALVLEYKRPSLLKADAEIEKALRQLKNYLLALSGMSDAPFVGMLTNGLILIEVRASGGAIVSQSASERVSGAALLRLTQHFISLALTALTPSNLIRDFCGSQTEGVLFQTARVLNTILASPQPKTLMLFSEWEEMFRLAHDDQSQQTRIVERRAALAELFSLSITTPEQEYRSLFALHTSYAILLKFMAYRTVSDIYLGEAGEDYRSLASAANSPLRTFCNGLEDGEVFRRLGIINLLEGDFFSWYCDRKQWTNELAESMRAILAILARYEEAGHIFEANEAPDIFRELYQAAVPRVVRSSFGEFYTPYWLAEQVLDSAAPKGEWRAIDPCCGSGTFVVAAISKLRGECRAQGMNDRETLKQIISRIAAVDLNPLGVLTTRINYFIHVSNLFANAKGSLVIPVYLGDAAAIPERITVEGVECLRFELKTLKNPIKTVLPVSLVQDTKKFMELMLAYEGHIKAQKSDVAKSSVMDAIQASDKKFLIRKAVSELTDGLIELEQNGWNGIWARILSNFLTTACLGRFTVVFGNPPWIDWRNLPEGYRERIKAMCVERGLFSGAGRTGGINLNICALISYVSMINWLAPRGRLAFLMPRELANQASYEGWRRLGGKWNFLEFHDWSDAGHPFDPVREDFMTFIIGAETRKTRSVPVKTWIKDSRSKAKAMDWKTLDAAMEELAPPLERVAGQIIPNSTAFTFADNQKQLDEFALVAGDCEYVGRQGVEFYPQELQLFAFIGAGPKPGTVWLQNIQVQKSKYRIQRRRVLLETVYLRPLMKGASIGQYECTYDGSIVAFPYEASDPLRPVSLETLRDTSPLLLNYYEQSREIIDQQTKYTDKIRGPDPGEFYGLARTGPYTFAGVHVAFHDNTKWGATVVTDADLPWEERSPFLFQKHAVSMCERRNSDGFISEDEAHFVCAIFNTPIVERFILATSDNRSFKIRPPVFVPLYDPEDDRHVLLAAISKEAHLRPERRTELRIESEGVYLTLCGDEAFDAMVATDRLGEIASGTVRLVTGDALQAELDSLLS